MQIITATITFAAGTAVVLSAVAAFAGHDRCSRIYAEPAVANTHVCYVGDNALATGTSTVDHVIKQLAKPTAADAVLDNFNMDSSHGGANRLELAAFSVDGTTSEKMRVTIWIG